MHANVAPLAGDAIIKEKSAGQWRFTEPERNSTSFFPRVLSHAEKFAARQRTFIVVKLSDHATLVASPRHPLANVDPFFNPFSSPSSLSLPKSRLAPRDIIFSCVFSMQFPSSGASLSEIFKANVARFFAPLLTIVRQVDLEATNVFCLRRGEKV